MNTHIDVDTLINGRFRKVLLEDIEKVQQCEELIKLLHYNQQDLYGLKVLLNSDNPIKNTSPQPVESKYELF